MRNDPAQLGFFLFFLSLWRLFIEMAMAQNTAIPVNAGVVLDFDTSLGKMGLSCIPLALSDFYASHGNYKARLVLKTRDSRDVGTTAAVLTTSLKTLKSSLRAMRCYVLDVNDVGVDHYKTSGRNIHSR
uniref:Uncharacterized protein n=1 Tax=Vitis vinifera TaxID=29760 RepID=A5B2E6_VITVI|nr:hypothetical protein VITISV_021882 [Vitis vinifera]